MVSDENCTYNSSKEIGVFNDNRLSLPQYCERQYASMEKHIVKSHKTKRLRNTGFIWYRTARRADPIFDSIVLFSKPHVCTRVKQESALLK